MQKLLSQLTSQFQGFYRSLTPTKRLSLGASIFIILLSITILFAMYSGRNYVTLFTNIPADQVAIVVDQLNSKNIPFRMDHSGNSILIPKELLHSTQMAIMTEVGSTRLGQAGLELFDNQDFGVTSYAQRINYQRALQGELIRAINTLNAVRQSKVMLALPPKKTFLEETSPPKASVIVELHAGQTLNDDQVRGITYLVANAVEGMEPSGVNVVDERGKVLSKNYSADAMVSSELIDMKRRVEGQLEGRIESILSRAVGAGGVIARVDASLNPRHTVTVEEMVDPDRTAIRSSQTEEEILDGARTNPAGVPGARANLPGAEDQGEVGFRQNVRKELRTQNFDVPKTVRNIRESAGNIEKISVAVMVDGVMRPVTGEDGTVRQEWVPRSADELARFETLVKNAIGFNAARGDDVKIESIKFQREDFSEADALLTHMERRRLIHALFKWSLLGLSLAMFFFIVVRPFMRWITDSFQDIVEDMLPRTIEELEELQSVDNSLPGMSGALPVLEDSLDPDKAESELLKERIMSLMENDDEKAAGAFSLWLARRDQ